MAGEIKNVRIGDILLENGFITPKQLEDALKKQRDKEENPEGLKLGDMLLKLGYVSETQLVHVLSTRLKVQFVDLTTVNINTDAVKKIPEELAKKYICIGYKIMGSRLFVATNDPINFYVFEELKVKTGMEIHPMLATKTMINEAITKFYNQAEANETLSALHDEYSSADADVAKAAEDAESQDRVDNAPIVKLVNSIVEGAFQRRASDIHIEPFRDRTRVRLRLDGELFETMQVKPTVHSSLITRLKIMGGMNIAEKRIPLDGQFATLIDGVRLDVRVSTLPTIYGEKCVMRLLAAAGDEKPRRVTEIGMTEYNYEMFKNIIMTPHGVMLVTGPTGSGKSTTLYATLFEISKPNVNIVTVEDPVEKKIDGVNQVQVNTKAGMTFGAALRSILRQDPDVVMVGEIRDSETAEIAIRAAITGHLVLSTLHTNDAASTILRLVDMGIPAYMVASSIIGVIAQRLVRLLCPKCKEVHLVDDPAEMRLLQIDEPINVAAPHKGGCKECGQTGYRGRTAIHEIITNTYNIKEIIANNGTAQQIEEQAIKNGTKLLRDNVCQMVKDGKTTIEELVKATFSV